MVNGSDIRLLISYFYQPSMASFALPGLPLPQPGETHIWQLYLPQAQAHCAPWSRWLSGDEDERAQRFWRPVDRDRYCLSRGGLRLLLARYLNCLPEQPVFAYSPYGKPYLAQPQAPLYFNLAHSGPWVVYGFSLCAVVGVDVEAMTRQVSLETLIQRCLTPAEQMALAPTLPERLQGFFQHWTIKEAHLKAVGLGLSYGLDQVEIRWQPQPHLVKAAPIAGQPIEGWTVEMWQPDDAAIAAVCVGQPDSTLIRRPFPLASDRT